MLYRVAAFLVRTFFHAVFFLKVIGKENVPKEGGLLLCSNHASYWDPPAIASAFPRSLRFMAKEELFKNPVFGKFITLLGAFPIRRGKGDAGAVMTAIKIVRSGNTTLIFPEGGRVDSDDAERKINPNIIKLAIMAKTSIVPCYTNGKYRLFGGLKIYFGKPVSYEQYYTNSPDGETLQRLANELMKAIYSFSEKAIPEKSR